MNAGVGTARRWILAAVTALGVSAFVTQLTLMRELLTIFSGNELVLGIVLGCWLLLTGIGAQIARGASSWSKPVPALLGTQLLLAILPSGAVLLTRSLPATMFVRGAELGVWETVVASLVVLGPYCLLTGLLLTLAPVVLARRSDSSSVGEVYFLDNLGDIFGGLLFSIFLVWWADPFRVVLIPGLLNIALASASAWVLGYRGYFFTGLGLGVGLLGVTLFAGLDHWSLALSYPGQRTIEKVASPYGLVVVTESSAQLNFFHSGVPLFSSHNIEQVEETVHPTMAQRPSARSVLVISGGISGTVRELLRYPGVHVDYVELDPALLHVADLHLPMEERLSTFVVEGRLRIVPTDGRRYVSMAKKVKYDIVIVDVPEPSTSQLNRYFTREFFARVRRLLNPGGVLSVSAGHYENVVTPELRELLSVLRRTLAAEFANVMILPLGRVHFLASEGPLSSEIADRLAQMRIQTQWVNKHYLQAALHPLRLQGLHRATVESDGPVNRDFSPILYYLHLKYWLSKFTWRIGALELTIVIGLIAYLIFCGPLQIAIFTTGFAGSSLVVVLMLGFQVLYGSVYSQLSWIITSFMIGLGIGSFVSNRFQASLRIWHLILAELLLAGFSAALPFALMGLSGAQALGLPEFVGALAIPALSLVVAIFVGLEFPLAGKLAFRTISGTAARLYTADYLGAALGALLASSWLIPYLGVIGLCQLVGAANLVSVFLLIWPSHRFIGSA